MNDRANHEAVSDLFGEACELDPDQQGAFVAAAEVPETVRREVLDLLAALHRSELDAEGLDPRMAAELLAAEAPTEAGGSGPLADDERRQIGPYRLQRRLARGGMGVVYLAERSDGAYEQQVALKLLPPSVRSTALVERFALERQILARLEHPSIARLLDGGTTEHGEPYLVMEFVPGVPITEWCETNADSVHDRLRLFVRVCEAVSYAHARLIVHRDIKPPNILVTDDGEVKLLDFGIAKLLSEEGDGAESALTRLGLRPHTPGYAAPEQRRGEPVTVATDVFGLGVLLYELLTGRRPDTGEGETWSRPEKPSTLATRIPTGTAPSTPVRLRRLLSGDLDVIALKALREEPAERYRSAEALGEDVRRHLEGLPIRARPASAAYRLRKFVQRNAAGVAATALVVLAVIGGLVGTTWQAREAARERDAARLETAKLAAAQEYLVGLFRAADPSEALGEDITARQLVERGIDRLGDLEDQPDIQLDMYRTLAHVALEIGDLERAAQLLEAAGPRARDHYGSDHVLTADLAGLRGRLHYESGEWSEAEAILEEAIATYERLGATDRRGMLDALEFLGMSQRSQDRPAEAIEIQRRAVELARRTTGSDSAETATHLNQLGILLGQVEDYPGAEAVLRESLAVALAVHGEEHPEVATTRVNLANALLTQGKLAEAEPHYREGVAMELHLRGPEHPSYAVKLHNLATFLHAAGRYEEAAELHREVLARLEERFGEEHPHVGATLDSLASDLAAAGLPEEAWPLYERAGRVLEATTGRESSLYAIHRRRLARAQFDAGNPRDAAEPVEEAIAILEGLGESAEAQLAIALGTRADLRLAAGSVTEAEADLRRALEIQRRNYPPRHYALGRSLLGLARILHAADRPDAAAEALSSAREAHEIFTATLPDDHPWRRQAEEVLAALESPASSSR